MPLAKHDDIVQAFLPDRADQPIRGRGQPFWVCGRDTSLSYPRPWAEPAVAAGPPAEPIQPQLAGSLLFASAPGAFIFTIMEHALARRRAPLSAVEKPSPPACLDCGGPLSLASCTFLIAINCDGSAGGY